MRSRQPAVEAAGPPGPLVFVHHLGRRAEVVLCVPDPRGDRVSAGLSPSGPQVGEGPLKIRWGWTKSPQRARSRIRSALNSATMAMTLNNSRPTDPSDRDHAAEAELHIAPGQLVQDVPGVGQGAGDPVELGRHKGVGGPAGGQRQRRPGPVPICAGQAVVDVGAIVAEAERVQGRRAERWDLAALLIRGRIPRSSSCRARTSGDGRGPPR
jgi:hypothetical protein